MSHRIHTPGLVPAIKAHDQAIEQLRAPRNPLWQYVTPVSPATAEDDYVDGAALYPPFEDPWANIDGRPATAFRMVEGNLQLRIYCTGGEGTPGSLIFTLPDGFRPTTAMHRKFAQVGELGESIGAVDVDTDGTVVFVNAIASFT